jgi:mono/diheme cytochrome c family protein
VLAVASFSFVADAVSEQQEADLELGAEMYRTQCEPCHGSEGKGDGPAARFLETTPRDLTSGHWMYVDATTVDEVARIVSEGIPGTEMEPFEELLLEEEILAVAAYVIAEFLPE